MCSMPHARYLALQRLQEVVTVFLQVLRIRGALLFCFPYA
jgi:hypothetical protein